MKKILLAFIFYLLSSNVSIANESSCSGIKKLSKEYLVCKAKNIQDGANNVNNKITIMADLMNIKENNVYLVNYFDKYVEYLLKNPLKNFTKDILETKF